MLNAQDIRIAIIDDDEDDYFIIAEYIQRIEGRKFVIDWCRDYNTALGKIRSRAYHIYFVDYRLGQHTGLELLKEACTPEFDDPIVLLTGKGNKDIDVQAMESGATDYLIKSELTTEKLERCIRYSLERAADLKELKDRENKYRNLFETSKDAIFIANDALVLREVNHAASLLFMSTIDQLIHRSLFEFIADPGQRNDVQLLAMSKENFSDFEIEIASPGTETRSCLLSLSFIPNPDGHGIVHGILHDITNIKKAEIANLQAQKLAANERLMRTLAHEIRNPLNNISLSIDHFTLPYEDTEKQKNLVAIIQRNCVRINHIITELLDLTKPPELTFQPHYLQEIVDDSLAMTMDRINLQKIKLEKQYPSEPVPILANKAKLIIAFTNILINAIEAMETGTGRLSVVISVTPEHNIVTISDNGNGIPEEYLTKLFEPFFTLKKNGVGLGLAASYSIVQSHNASIKVESKTNKGTEFSIRFNRDVAPIAG